ncbi:MAG: PD-(D/E)XK nuclease family protein [Myxococcota bacterium]
MADLPPYLSVSQVTTYLGCPRKYRFRYVERREPEKRSADLALGSAVHSAIEWWANERMAGRSPEADAALRILRVDWHAQTATNEYDFEDRTPEELKLLGENLVRLFVERFKEEVPLGSEQRFEVELRHPLTGVAIPPRLVGVIDLVLDGALGEIKTAARKTGVETYILQLAAYSYAWRETMGVRPKIRVIELIKTKTPKVEVEEVTLTDRQEAWFVEVAIEAYFSMLAGAFHPNPGWMCERCEYRRACRLA